MKPLTTDLIDQTIDRAQASPRKRAHFLFHQHSDPVQRMINALLPGSYIPPHVHQHPPKIEFFTILTGRVACIHFSESGNIQHVYLMDPAGPIRGVDIPPGQYHSFIALKPSALLEIIQGPYQKLTHKSWPDWAPAEDSPAAQEYLKSLEKQVKDLLQHQ